MLVCATCGASSVEGARFCQACGARLAEGPARLRKTITSLFCDLVGSTPLAESLADPEAIHDVLTRYLRAMTAVIERHGGAVEKFAGDAILGTFGVPLSHEDDAIRAVRAALEMREALSSLNGELEARWGVSLRLKIGINSGEVLTGDSVAGQAMTLGDPVNLAARLEQTAAPGEIILGESTYRLAGAAVDVDEPRQLEVKGKSARVAAYRLVALTPQPARATRRYARPMVGRSREMQALRDAYRRVVRDERSEVVAVVGSPGAGKSRLVAALAAEVEDEASILVGRSPSYGERTTFWPLAEIVRAHAGVLPTDDAAAVRSKLAGAVDRLVEDRGERLWIGARLAVLAGPAAPDEEARDALESFTAWRRFLERLAADRPLVLVFEDLHWAGEALLEFLASLGGRAAPILALATARPELREGGLGGPATTVLRLAPMNAAEIGALAEDVAGEPLPAGLRREVIARVGGNPLFAEALVTMIGERGLERTADVDVPDTVEALVAARVDALPPFLRSLVLDAAVVGSSIRGEAIASMRDHDLAAVKNGLEDLVAREFLHPVGDVNGFEFVNGIVREVAYRAIPRAVRSTTHRAFAEWLDQRNRDDAVDLLAHHYGRAFDLAVEARELPEVRRHLAERTFHHGVPAAARALRATDPGSAATLLAHAAHASSEIPAPDLHAVGEAGVLHVKLGRWSEAVEFLSPFAEEAHPTIERELGIAMCKLHRDDPRGTGYRRGQAFLERAAAHDDPDAIASLAGTWKGIDESKALELYRRASEIDPADPYPLGNLLEHAIQVAGDLSPVEEVRDRVALAIERCRQQAAGGRNLPWAHYDHGKFLLMLELPYASLEAYAKAVDLSPAMFMVETSLSSLRSLSNVADRVPGLTWTHDLLALALRARFEDAPHERSDSRHVVIFAGGTSAEDDDRTGEYGPILREAFRGFTGTVISGGTTQGVSGLAGDLGEQYPDAVHTVGYLPDRLPPGAAPDVRYNEMRRTEADSFSPLEPLTYWDDLLGAGIRASQVWMIGIGGAASPRSNTPSGSRWGPGWASSAGAAGPPRRCCRTRTGPRRRG